MTPNHRQTSVLVRLYNEQPLTVDKLPYTSQFHDLVTEFARTFPLLEGITKHGVYNFLIRLRKAGKLLRKTKSKKPRRAPDR